MTPPPATINGRFDSRMSSTARRRAVSSGSGRPIGQTRLRMKPSGTSNASACTSCGNASVTGDHARRARPDGRRTCERAEPVLLARVAGGRVHHSLLAPRLVVPKQIRPFVECLPDPGDIAMAEDPEAAAEELVLDPVSLG